MNRKGEKGGNMEMSGAEGIKNFFIHNRNVILNLVILDCTNGVSYVTNN